MGLHGRSASSVSRNRCNLTAFYAIGQRAARQAIPLRSKRAAHWSSPATSTFYPRQRRGADTGLRGPPRVLQQAAFAAQASCIAYGDRHLRRFGGKGAGVKPHGCSRCARAPRKEPPYSHSDTSPVTVSGRGRPYESRLTSGHHRDGNPAAWRHIDQGQLQSSESVVRGS